MTSPGTETVLGVFAHVDTTVRALEELKAKGYHDLTVYTPVPVHQIEEVLERGRPVSRVRLFTLVGGLTGTASGFFLTIWSAMQWNLVTGGKPIASIPPFVVIAFELTILFGGVATLLGLLVLARLPRLRPSPTFDPRFTNDRFGVAVRVAPGRGGSVREILTSAGAEEVRP
ncbi:MAG TPA: DUF3341 domain-containing protein [Calidithermus sp.]|nr:DUF3341 domain-containing protein [Calidithermus sp.]